MAFRDGFDRLHDDLRISVTDRCNLRCAYCLPDEPVWFPRSEVLTYEELRRLVRIAVGRGVRTLRITGGEPLVRRDLPRFVRMLAALDGVEDISLTTNGVLLEPQAAALADAGLARVNVSLDTLVPERFERLTRRRALDRVLRGLRAAAGAGLSPIKINTVLAPGVNDDEVESLAERARDAGWELRFIECMPLENDGSWHPERVVSGESVRRRIAARWPLRPDERSLHRAPATRFLYRDGRGAVGFVDSVTRPFCGSCGRLRLTCDGKWRVCLYDRNEVDLKTPLREGADDRTLEQRMIRAVAGKGRGGALEILERRAGVPLERTMHQIGG